MSRVYTEEEKLLHAELLRVSKKYEQERLSNNLVQKMSEVYTSDKHAEEDNNSFAQNATDFVNRNDENSQLNQYWYSIDTSSFLCNLIIEGLSTISAVDQTDSNRLAFLSTPSLFFTMSNNDESKNNHVLFEFDEQWNSHKHFVFYDFNRPIDVIEQNPRYGSAFDMVIIDPPFVTVEAWEKYAKTAKALLKPGGLILATTIFENAKLLETLLDLKPIPSYKPKIPNLIYQYTVFTNFQSRTKFGKEDEKNR